MDGAECLTYALLALHLNCYNLELLVLEDEFDISEMECNPIGFLNDNQKQPFM